MTNTLKQIYGENLADAHSWKSRIIYYGSRSSLSRSEESSQIYEAVADPISRSNFLHFYAVFSKKIYQITFWCSSPGKSWTSHCKDCKIEKGKGLLIFFSQH